jgi:hypothetical protein
MVWMAYQFGPAGTRVNFSHDWSTVALLWITSVVRPPPPTAVSQFPLEVLMP